jgi:UDP-N-acetylglucosamine transferase subunit ALG13
MIFVTVGTQLPFDRLISTVDQWAGRTGEPVFAQVGPSQRTFENLDTIPFLSPEEAGRKFSEASVIIAHAGMGTIFTALAARKPLLVLPRQGRLGEHRNDHQMATARRLRDRGLITVAWTEEELDRQLDSIDALEPLAPIAENAEDLLLDSVRRFLQS